MTRTALECNTCFNDFHKIKYSDLELKITSIPKMKERNPIRKYIGKQYNHNWNFAHFYPQSSIIYQYRFTIKYNLLSHTFFLNIKNIIFTGTYISYIRLSPLVFSFLSNVLFDIVRRLIRKSYFHLRESFRRHFY